MSLTVISSLRFLIMYSMALLTNSFFNFPPGGAEHRARLLESVVAPLLQGVRTDNPVLVHERLEAQVRTLAIQCGEPGPFAQVLAGIDSDYDNVVAGYWKSLIAGAQPNARSLLEADMRRMQREPSTAMIRSIFANDPLPSLSAYRGPKFIIDTLHGDGQAALFADPATITWLTGFAPPVQLGPYPFAGGPPLLWYEEGRFTLIVVDLLADGARSFAHDRDAAVFPHTSVTPPAPPPVLPRVESDDVPGGAFLMLSLIHISEPTRPY